VDGSNDTPNSGKEEQKRTRQSTSMK